MNKTTFTSNPAKGMRDILPQEVILRDHVFSIISKTYADFGFTKIETPAVEHIHLLRGSNGGENEKLIFSILKRGLKSEDLTQAKSYSDLVDYGLRFDLTIPLARYYANNQAHLPNPFKAIQMGPVWRGERPQKGRYRQFVQCDIDIMGEATYLAEMELIQATTTALLNIGFEGFTLKINDRRILQGLVQAFGFETHQFDDVFVIVDKLDKIGIEGIKKELISKDFNSKSINDLIDFLSNPINLDTLPKSIDKVVISELSRIISVSHDFAEHRFKVEFDPTLVRGMGYYTGPIFEIVDRDFPSSLAGGGRYDKMIGTILGKDIPACGFSIGFERILTLLQERNQLNLKQKNKVAILVEKDYPIDKALYVANDYRERDFIVTLVMKKKNTKFQLDQFKEHGYERFTILHDAQEEIRLQFMD